MSGMNVAYWRTGKIMGEATMDDAELISYCSIVDPECGNCKMYEECSGFKEKFGIFPLSANLVQTEWW